jgi:hypothetical protein
MMGVYLSFSADKVKKNLILDFIEDRYNNPMDFITSPEGDAIISLIAGRIGVSKITAVALFTASIGYSRYKYTDNQISKQEMQNEITRTMMTTGAGIATGIGGGLILGIELYYLNEGAKKLNEFNKEFEIWINNLPKYWNNF